MTARTTSLCAWGRHTQHYRFMATPRLTAKQREDRQQSRVIKRADALHAKKMRQLCKRDKVFYHSLFMYPIIKSFSKIQGLFLQDMVLLLLYDIYPNLCFDDATLWGLCNNKQCFYILKKNLSKRGLIVTERYNSYITLKGKGVFAAFNEYYNKHVAIIIRYTENGAKNDDIRKIIRAKPAKQHPDYH